MSLDRLIECNQARKTREQKELQAILTKYSKYPIKEIKLPGYSPSDVDMVGGTTGLSLVMCVLLGVAIGTSVAAIVVCIALFISLITISVLCSKRTHYIKKHNKKLYIGNGNGVITLDDIKPRLSNLDIEAILQHWTDKYEMQLIASSDVDDIEEAYEFHLLNKP